MNNKQEKVWGLYNTLDNLDSFGEIDIWIKINNLESAISWSMYDKRKPCGTLALIEAEYNLEYLIYYTRKFGVQFNREPSLDKHMEKSESYNAWFKFWSDLYEAMPTDVYRQFISDKYSGKDVSKYMPTNSCKDILEKPVQKVLN